MSRRVVNYMETRVAPLDNPRQLGKALTGQWAGYWRYRVGRCRVICDIQDRALRIIVVRAGQRDDVYRLR